MNKETSFDIDQRILDMIAREFDVNELISNFAESIEDKKREVIEAAAERLFETYGRKLMDRTIELGEKYLDRTYEVMNDAAKKTGVGPFPHVCQRFLEIFNMGTQHKPLTVVVSNTSKLTHRVGPCVFMAAIKEKCGKDVADLLTCKRIDLSAMSALYTKFNLHVDVQMDASIPCDGYCQFIASRIT